MFKLLKGMAIATVLFFFLFGTANAENVRSLSVSSLNPLLAMAGSEETEYFPLHSIDEIENFLNNRANVLVKNANYRGYESLQEIVSPKHRAIDPSLPIDEQVNACDSCTFLNIPTQHPFHNGEIEIDVASTLPENAPGWAKGFIGIMFRVDARYFPDGTIDAKHSTYEGFYLRPVNSQSDRQSDRDHSVQYISMPGYAWYYLRRNSPGKYETYTPLQPGNWTKMRIEVQDTVARLYLNDSLEPALIVNDLKQGKELSGTIGLYTEPQTIAYFKNLKITHIP
ncbi:MAG: family 16 glycoside hydrolase [Cyanobacteria bacterium P01_E01_bin.42]